MGAAMAPDGGMNGRRAAVPSREPLLQAYLGQVFPHDLDEVGHGEVHDVVSPGRLQDHVGPQQVVAGEQAGGEALLLVFAQEPGQQLLRQLHVFGFRRVLHGVLPVEKRKLA